MPWPSARRARTTAGPGRRGRLRRGWAARALRGAVLRGARRINGLPGKGVIAPGHDADLVVFDPAESRTVDGRALHMGTDFSPFDGRELRGWPQAVVAGGRVVLDEHGFHDPGPAGRFVPRLGYREAAQQAAAQDPGGRVRSGRRARRRRGGVTMVQPARPVRIGMIVPSSNTCLEPMTYRILGTART
ncbi:hypothetical protein [Sinomonas sp. P47F7]|uniref:hypothetical protein n=1 Tax=Sinomonas sp. P47F7 TaxID=3410987 RepID=UPI003BF475CB